MWYSREGPRVFWLSPGETSAQARDPFISVRIRSHVGISRRFLRLPVGKDVDVTEQEDHSFLRPRSCRLTRLSMHACTTSSSLQSAKIMPSLIRSKRKLNRERLTIAVTDLHSNTNQAPVAAHDRATLLREHYFSYMFACSGSFQLPSVRHVTPITRSTRLLTETGRREASLIFSRA